MSEDTNVPDDAGEAQGSPGAEEESSAAEETADSEDAAQAEGAEDDESTETEETDEGEPTTRAEGRKESGYDKLLKKYGGNKEAMAEAYWEQANSHSRLHDRLASIEEYVKGQQEKPVDEAKAVEADPDVQALKEEITETETQARAVLQEQKRLISEYGKAEKVVAKLEGKLEASDPDAASEIRQQLAEARSDSRRIEGEIRSAQSTLRGFDKELKGLGRQLKGAEQEARDKVSRQRQEEQTRREEAREVREEFVEAVRTEAESYGIDPASGRYRLMLITIRDRISSYLSNLPPSSPGLNIPEAVGVLMKEYADDQGWKREFQTKSAVKRAASPTQLKPTPRTTGAPASTKGQPKSWADYKANAKRALG